MSIEIIETTFLRFFNEIQEKARRRRSFTWMTAHAKFGKLECDCIIKGNSYGWCIKQVEVKNLWSVYEISREWFTGISDTALKIK